MPVQDSFAAFEKQMQEKSNSLQKDVRPDSRQNFFDVLRDGKWAEEVQTDASFDDIYKLAEGTLFSKLPGGLVKTFCETFEQAAESFRLILRLIRVLIFPNTQSQPAHPYAISVSTIAIRSTQPLPRLLGS